MKLFIKDWQGKEIKLLDIYQINIGAIFVYIIIGVVIGYLLFK